MCVVAPCDCLNPAWRVVVGLSLIPAFGTLYQRLTLPESTRYENTKKGELNDQDGLKEKDTVKLGVRVAESEQSVDKKPSVAVKKAHFRGMVSCYIESVPCCDRCFRGYSILLSMEASQDTHRNLHMLVSLGHCVCLAPSLKPCYSNYR